jgi:hypothetical protein
MRLPNPALTDPVLQHRKAAYAEARQASAFWQHVYGPHGHLKLRQGFGRLIRREDDAGLFVLMDGRFLTSAPMRAYARSLPLELDPVPAGRMAEWYQRSLAALPLPPPPGGSDASCAATLVPEGASAEMMGRGELDRGERFAEPRDARPRRRALIHSASQEGVAPRR